MEDRNALERNCHCTGADLNKVYHSESMHEMEVNADLLGVDLCNPYVLLFIAKQTAYRHAFWSHTKKRFTAFKNILRHNKSIKESLKDMKFYALICRELDEMLKKYKGNSLYSIPGLKKEQKNIEQVINIVEKAIAESK